MEINVSNIRMKDAHSSILCEFDVTVEKIKEVVLGQLMRDCKYIKGTKGNFVAMFSRKKPNSEPPEYYSIVDWPKPQKSALLKEIQKVIERELNINSGE